VSGFKGYRNWQGCLFGDGAQLTISETGFLAPAAFTCERQGSQQYYQLIITYLRWGRAHLQVVFGGFITFAVVTVTVTAKCDDHDFVDAQLQGMVAAGPETYSLAHSL
jgi:hypothetical protein